MVPLSLFSSKVSDEDKILIVEAMVSEECDWSVKGMKCPIAESTHLERKHLRALVTSSSAAALRSLGLDIPILSKRDPQTWDVIISFSQTKAVVNNIQVVNDTAERSIALMSNFNQSITKTV